VVFPLTVERDSRDRWKEIAEHNGISASAMFDALVNNIELTMNGRPVWLPEPLIEPSAEETPRPPKDGELRIDTA
jgi:hypothetical protein